MDAELLGDFPTDNEDALFSLVHIPISTSEVKAPVLEFDTSFRLEEPRNFSKPYHHLYNRRLEKLSILVTELATERFPHSKIIKVIDLMTDKSVAFKKDLCVQRPPSASGWSEFKNPVYLFGKFQVLKATFKCSVVIIGTIIRDRKPPVLPEFGGKSAMERKTPEKTDFALEDTSGKIFVSFNPEMASLQNSFINGMVCGLYGNVTEDGTFLCTDIIHAEPEIKLMRNPQFHCKIVLVSGVMHGAIEKNKSDRLFTAIHGFASSTTRNNNLIVFFIGNTFSLDKKKGIELDYVIQNVDEKLATLAEVAHVVIIPGLKDPTPPMLPHQPLKRLFFRRSGFQRNFHAETNPCRVYVKAVNDKPMEMLLCSGETVDDYMKASGIHGVLTAAKLMIWNGHLCPTAPDATSISPGLESDVFALDKAPAFFVVGNQEHGEMRLSKRTVYVSVPSYIQKQQVVVFNGDCTPNFVDIM